MSEIKYISKHLFDQLTILIREGISELEEFGALEAPETMSESLGAILDNAEKDYVSVFKPDANESTDNDQSNIAAAPTMVECHNGAAYPRSDLLPEHYARLNETFRGYIDEMVQRYAFFYPLYVAVKVIKHGRLSEFTCRKGIGALQALRDAGITIDDGDEALINGNEIFDSTQLNSFSLINIFA